MKAVLNGVVLADSDETILIEGNRYFPSDSVNSKYLKPSSMRSLCPWKGMASYYHVEAGGKQDKDAAWTYSHPFPWIRKIRHRVAFWGDVEIRE